MTISPIDTSNCDSDIYPAMLISTLNPKRNISAVKGSHNYRRFNSPRFEGIKNDNYLGSEAYINAVSQKGFIERVRVFLHRSIGKK